jgi:hypothetical protein
MTNHRQDRTAGAAGDDDDRLLRGAQAIADELGMSLRATYHQLALGNIPASKQGDTWISTRKRVRGPYYGMTPTAAAI